MHVVVFSMFGGWWDFVSYEERVCRELLKSGNKVTYINCDGVFKYCDNKLRWKNHQWEEAEICNMCRQGTSNTEKLAKHKYFKHYKIGDYMNWDIDKKREISSMSKLVGATYMTTTSDFKCSASFIADTNDGEIKEINDTMVEDAFIFYDALRSVYIQSGGDWDLGFMTHAHRTFMSTFDKFLENRSIPSVNFMGIDHKSFEGEFILSSRDECFPIRQNNIAPRLLEKAKLSDLLCEKFKSKSSLTTIFKRTLAESENKDIIKLAEKYKFKDKHLVSVDEIKPDHVRDKSLEKYILNKIDQHQEVVLICTSTESEERSTFTMDEIGCMWGINKAVIKEAQEHKDILFIVRDHPNKYITKKYSTPENSLFADKYKINKLINKNDNIIFIDPWDNISTHWLLWKSDIVISAHSEICRDALISGCYVVTSEYNVAKEVADIIITKNDIYKELNLINKIIHAKINASDESRKMLDKLKKLLVYESCITAWIPITRNTLEVSGHNILLVDTLNYYAKNWARRTYSECVYELGNGVITTQSEENDYLEDYKLLAKLVEKERKTRKNIEVRSTDQEVTKYIKGIDYIMSESINTKELGSNGLQMIEAIKFVKKNTSVIATNTPDVVITDELKNKRPIGITHEIIFVDKNKMYLSTNNDSNGVEDMVDKLVRIAKFYKLASIFVVLLITYWRVDVCRKCFEKILKAKDYEEVLCMTYGIMISKKPGDIIKTSWETRFFLN